jgi:hypothetical protein
MATEFVECVLASGFFDDEFYVVVGDSSAIVDRKNVQVTSEPNGLTDGRGKLCVYIIERKADRLLVEIPGQPVVGGLRTWIEMGHPSAIA